MSLQTLSDRTIDSTINALGDRSHAVFNRLTNELFESSNIPTETIKLIEYRKELFFSTIVPTYVCDLLRDGIAKDKIDSKYKRFAKFSRYIAPKLILKSDLISQLGARLTFLRRGLVIGEENGKERKVSLDSILKESIQSIDTFTSFLDSSVKYIRGFAEAYENQKLPSKNVEILPMSDLVEENAAEMYALLKTFGKGKVTNYQALRKKYDSFAKRFLTNGEKGEYAYMFSQPFDLILQMGRFLCEIVGSPDSWMGIIEYVTTNAEKRNEILNIFNKTKIPEEARTFLDKHTNTLYEKLQESIVYGKQIISLSSRDLYRKQINVMQQFDTKEKQREVLRKYGPLFGNY